MKDPKAYRHLFFDMDGTVTRSRSPITPKMKTALGKLLASGRDVIIVSGQGVDAIQNQVGVGSFYMGQNGNHAFDVQSGKDLWRAMLSDSEKEEALRHINTLLAEIPAVKDTNDLIEDRGSQICFSFLGHHEEIEKKEAFDADKAKRLAILKKYPLVSDTIEVLISGTTTLDYIEKGHNKGSNIPRLIKSQGWNKDESMYVGDALFPGGNDEAVIGVIDVHSVANPQETLGFIDGILGIL